MNIDYRKILSVLAKGNKWQFDMPINKQLGFLNQNKKPSDDIQRSFLQYKAQMLFVALLKRFLFNIVSLFVFPFFIIVALLKRTSVKFKYNVEAIEERNTHSGVIPTSLSEKYTMSQKEWNIGWSLGVKDVPFILKLSVYFCRSPYFVFKITYKLALYSSMIKAFTPRAIIVFNEYSFTSSALTNYCELRNVKHIDVMHGEKLFYIRDSYFRFSQTYVWDEYYVDLFTQMMAPKEQFIAELPPFMAIQPSNYLDAKIKSDYTYYLASYDDEQIKSIVNSMEFAKEQGKIVKYRPHPRYSDINLLRKYVDESNIEYPKNVDIMVSVANTSCAVGVYTTVLNQAYHAGKKVIIDDINFPEYYGKLKELRYFLTYKSIKSIVLLSNFQQ